MPAHARTYTHTYIHIYQLYRQRNLIIQIVPPNCNYFRTGFGSDSYNSFI